MLAVSRQYSRLVDDDTLMSQKHTLPSSCLSINSTPVSQQHTYQAHLSINGINHTPVNQQYTCQSTGSLTRLSINSTPVNQWYQSHTCQSVAHLSINILKLQLTVTVTATSLCCGGTIIRTAFTTCHTHTSQDVSNMTEKLV